jgi:hypothetical protein
LSDPAADWPDPSRSVLIEIEDPSEDSDDAPLFAAPAGLAEDDAADVAPPVSEPPLFAPPPELASDDAPFKAPAELASDDAPFEAPTELASDDAPFEAPAELASDDAPFEAPAELVTEEPLAAPAELVTEEPLAAPAELVTEEPLAAPAELVTEEPLAALSQVAEGEEPSPGESAAAEDEIPPALPVDRAAPDEASVEDTPFTVPIELAAEDAAFQVPPELAPDTAAVEALANPAPDVARPAEGDVEASNAVLAWVEEDPEAEPLAGPGAAPDPADPPRAADPDPADLIPMDSAADDPFPWDVWEPDHTDEASPHLAVAVRGRQDAVPEDRAAGVPVDPGGAADAPPLADAEAPAMFFAAPSRGPVVSAEALPVYTAAPPTATVPPLPTALPAVAAPVPDTAPVAPAPAPPPPVGWWARLRARVRAALGAGAPAPSGPTAPDLSGTNLDRLELLLQRYLDRDVRGRLMVLSSARGTGKTTLAQATLRRLRPSVGAGAPPPDDDLGRPIAPSWARLLYVPVNASLLFAETASGAVGDPAAAVQRELVAALHSAVLRTLSERLPAGEALERLRWALMQGDADGERLRELWEDLDALESGLFADGARPDPDDGRASREISAIQALNRAYMVIAGDTKRAREQASGTQETRETLQKVEPDWAKLVGPAFTLGAGGLLGITLFPDAPVLSAALALVSALGVGSTLSITRKRERSANRSESFNQRYDDQALVRWMPELLQQMKDIGLSPVFVVDEVRLPEWSPIPAHLLALLEVCRGVVNNGASFCLLLDHTSYRTLGAQPDELRRRVAGVVTDRLFLSLRPDQILARARRAGETSDVEACRRVLGARGRPLALSVEPGVLASGELAVAYQAAIRDALDSEPRARDNPEDRALALELLYGPIRTLEAGERGIDLTSPALTAALRERGWIGPQDAAPDWLPGLMDRWIERMPEWVERAGPYARWRRDIQGSELAGWFVTVDEAEAFQREIGDTLHELAGLQLDAWLSQVAGLAAARPGDALVARLFELQALLGAGLLLAWLSAEPTLGTPAIEAGIRRWRAHLGQGGMDGRQVQRDLLELASLCGVPDARLAPWPLDAEAWSRSAWDLFTTLQQRDSGRQGHRAAVATRGRTAWRSRVEQMARGAQVPTPSARFLGWAVADPKLDWLASLRLERRGVDAWSRLAMENKADLGDMPALAWRALGFGVARGARSVLVYCHQPAEELEEAGAPDWVLPAAPGDLRVFVSRRPAAWRDLDVAFTDVLWVIHPRGGADVDGAITRERDALPAGCRMTLCGGVDDTDRARLEAATGLPCVPIRDTLAATLGAADDRRRSGKD